MNNRTTEEFVPASSRGRSRRKRFLIVSVPLLGMLGVMMGVSFLDNSGGTTDVISAAPNAIVYPVAATGNAFSLPLGNGAADPLTTTAFSGNATLAGCSSDVVAGNGTVGTSGYNCSNALSTSTSTVTSSAIVPPSWSPSGGTAGTVSAAGDLAIVDATSAPDYVTVNVYLTNLAALLIDYSSFAFPINVYQTTCNSSSCTPWQPASTEVAQGSGFGSYLTSTQGELSFTLPHAVGRYYDIVMEGTNHFTNGSSTVPTGSPAALVGTTSSGIGGAYVTTQTNTNPGSLSPTFFFSASAS